MRSATLAVSLVEFFEVSNICHDVLRSHLTHMVQFEPVTSLCRGKYRRVKETLPELSSESSTSQIFFSNALHVPQAA